MGGLVRVIAGGVAGAASTKQTFAAGTTLEFKTAQVATFTKTVTVQASAPGN